MEKLLANFLKGLGITPELIQEKMQTFLDTVEKYDKRLAYVEARQRRVEIMLLRLCKKSKIDVADIYEPLDNLDLGDDLPSAVNRLPKTEKEPS